MSSNFEIKGKVALITGGASGIGLCYAKELLKHGLRGVTLADVNPALGDKALKEIEEEFGPNRAIFVKTDVTNINEFEEAFKKTVAAFKNVDILVNNAGIYNDAIWEKEIAININGVVHGLLLGIENFIPKYRTGPEGVIVNISSIVGLAGASMAPIYSATKFAVRGLTESFGRKVHYDRTKVRVIALCPGGTDTLLLQDTVGKSLGKPYEKIQEEVIKATNLQKPEGVAGALAKIIQKADIGTVWVFEHGQGPYEYIAVDRESCTNNTL